MDDDEIKDPVSWKEQIKSVIYWLLMWPVMLFDRQRNK